MRLRALRRLEEIEIKGEHKKLTAERKDLKALLEGREAAVAADRRGGPGDQAQVRRQDRARQAPHRARRRAGRGRACGRGFRRARARSPSCCSDKGWIRAAKGHLDDKAGGRAQVQGRRRGALCRARPVDRQGPGVRHQRPLLHAGLRQAAERARPWRADPADDRARQRAGHRGARGAAGAAASSSSRPMPAAASSCPRTRSWRRPRTASRC